MARNVITPRRAASYGGSARIKRVVERWGRRAEDLDAMLDTHLGDVSGMDLDRVGQRPWIGWCA